MLSLEMVLLLSAVLFVIGVIGVIIRRNLIVILMCIELMLNSANLAFIAFARFHQNLDGQIAVFFVMAIAAVEVAVGLALIILIYRNRKTVNIDDLRDLKG
ncbi:MAG: NADH-quinone oxidoreductase subunit NuoK [Acidobacteria bacterium]|nr:NADH-quinone oxidoreductase subunit NuoK [Acidobacteriota bacterium]